VIRHSFMAIYSNESVPSGPDQSCKLVWSNFGRPFVRFVTISLRPISGFGPLLKEYPDQTVAGIRCCLKMFPTCVIRGNRVSTSELEVLFTIGGADEPDSTVPRCKSNPISRLEDITE